MLSFFRKYHGYWCVCVKIFGNDVLIQCLFDLSTFRWFSINMNGSFNVSHMNSFIREQSTHSNFSFFEQFFTKFRLEIIFAQKKSSLINYLSPIVCSNQVFGVFNLVAAFILLKIYSMKTFKLFSIH